MKDVIVIAIVVAFFALCIGYVTWCERVVAAGSTDLHGHAAEHQVVGRAASTAGAADTDPDLAYPFTASGAGGSEAGDARRF